MTASTVPAVAPTGTENPFVGLRPFDIDDADLFFGRNKQTYELLRRLHTLHFVAVLGPSGCGKSSLIRAGVLAALRDGYLADDGPWTIAMLEPGVDPLAAWTFRLSPLLKPGYTADALLTNPADALDTSRGPLVILVDQFEDLFRYGSRSDKRGDVQQFIDAMLATGRADARIYLILTMRSEYLPDCAVYADLAAAINEGLYLVPRMDREQMKQAIVGQVRKGGAAIATELVDRLLDDAASEDDSLPVLQHALMQIWPKRQRWEPMGMDLYPASGGLATFLDQHAEAVYSTLTPEQKDAAQALFRAITDMAADGRPARRPLPFQKVVEETGRPAEPLKTVVDAFTREGFLRVRDEKLTTIDITHEAIARQWRRLGVGFLEIAGDQKTWREGWITTEARQRRAVVVLRDAASDWERNDKDKAYLFRGNRLERLLRDLGDEVKRVDVRDRAFLDASQRNDWWDHILSRQVVGRALLGLILVAAAVFSVFYIINRARVQALRAQEETAMAQVLVSSAEAETKAAQSLATNADAEKLKAETLYRQVKETTPAVNPPPNPTAPTKPRLYTQLWNDDQERTIAPILKSVAASLEIVVPHIERVTVGPSHDELRYFRPGDAAEAQRIASALSEKGVKPRVSYVKGFESSTRIREGHFELWLAAPATTTQSTPDIGASQAPVIDSILATAREYPPGLELRILGRWLDADAQIRIDGRSIDRSRVVVSVLAPSSSAKFATDLSLILRDATLQPPGQPHKVTFVNGNGRSVDASIQLGHQVSVKKQ
jgi:Novel STAND NTPase 1